MPRELRDPYSKAKLFIPTVQEKTVKELENTYREKISLLDSKTQEIDTLINELKKERGEKPDGI